MELSISAMETENKISVDREVAKIKSQLNFHVRSIKPAIIKVFYL